MKFDGLSDQELQRQVGDLSVFVYNHIQTKDLKSYILVDIICVFLFNYSFALRSF